MCITKWSYSLLVFLSLFLLGGCEKEVSEKEIPLPEELLEEGHVEAVVEEPVEEETVEAEESREEEVVSEEEVVVQIKADSDSDGVSDADDACEGYDDANNYDSDNMPDGCDDSDNDGLTDYEELAIYGTDILDDDTDGDSLHDGDELDLYKTNPLYEDSDYDGVDDNIELSAGTDPLDPDSYIPDVAPITDCGEDISCFIEEARTCSPTTFDHKQKVNFFGIIIEGHAYYELRKDDNVCSLYMQYISHDVSFDEETIEKLLEMGKTEEEIEEDLAKANAKGDELEGLDGICTTDPEQIVALFERWEEGKFSSSDWAGMNCEGSYFDKIYISPERT